MNAIYYTTLPAFKYYFRPKSAREAISLLNDYGNEAKILAGGTDLLVLMQNRTLTTKYIIDISRIPGLNYIEHDNDVLRIGALATLRALELSPTIKAGYLSLYEAAHQMGNTQVRNMGTVVGNICRASPAADPVLPLLVMGCHVKIVGHTKSRTVPLDQFFVGPGQTVVGHNEMVTEVKLTKLSPASGTAFFRLTRVASDVAKVNVASAVTARNGVCEDVRIALGGVAPTPIRARKAEELLRGSRLDARILEQAATTAADEAKPITDNRSTEGYRKEVSRVLVRRAIDLALKRARRSEER